MALVEDDADIRDDAIVEQPRSVRKHPLLSEIYEHHDELIADFLPSGDTLEVAFGQYMHPRADVGLEAWPSNVAETDSPAIAGDARSLPFETNSFDAVIGRRFLHHVPQGDRVEILREAARVVAPGGRIVLLEGTPGYYRRATKGIAFRMGLLGADSDIYGHLTSEELYETVSSTCEVLYHDSLGSPLMPASISESGLSKHLFPVYRRTQFVKWWTLVVGEVA
jgi:SAM-dependent methyltransferase